MKLVTLNTETTPSQRIGYPTVRFSTGQTNFNPKAADLLQLKNDDTIEVHQEEDDPANWYISVGGPNGFKVRVNEKGVNFNNANLARVIMKSFDYPSDATSIGFRIEEEPTKVGKVKYYPLLHMPRTEKD